MANIKCIDCFQGTIIVEANKIIDAPLRGKIDTGKAMCEGCFKTKSVKYMCPWGHFMCEECSTFDISKCKNTGYWDNGKGVEQMTPEKLNETLVKRDSRIQEVINQIKKQEISDQIAKRTKGIIRKKNREE